MGSEPDIDFERIINDPDYRRRIIVRLRAEEAERLAATGDAEQGEN